MHEKNLAYNYFDCSWIYTTRCIGFCWFTLIFNIYFGSWKTNTEGKHLSLPQNQMYIEETFFVFALTYPPLYLRHPIGRLIVSTSHITAHASLHKRNSAFVFMFSFFRPFNEDLLNLQRYKTVVTTFTIQQLEKKVNQVEGSKLSPRACLKTINSHNL